MDNYRLVSWALFRGNNLLKTITNDWHYCCIHVHEHMRRSHSWGLTCCKFVILTVKQFKKYSSVYKINPDTCKDPGPADPTGPEKTLRVKMNPDQIHQFVPCHQTESSSESVFVFWWLSSSIGQCSDGRVSLNASTETVHCPSSTLHTVYFTYCIYLFSSDEWSI